jgi:hypothetical protein
LALVSGRGTPIAAIELSLTRDVASLASRPPEPWADA